MKIHRVTIVSVKAFTYVGQPDKWAATWRCSCNGVDHQTLVWASDAEAARRTARAEHHRHIVRLLEANAEVITFDSEHSELF